eukprot:351479-Chlamydomonas_euryale.AAC.12
MALLSSGLPVRRIAWAWRSALMMCTLPHCTIESHVASCAVPCRADAEGGALRPCTTLTPLQRGVLCNGAISSARNKELIPVAGK